MLVPETCSGVQWRSDSAKARMNAKASSTEGLSNLHGSDMLLQCPQCVGFLLGTSLPSVGFVQSISACHMRSEYTTGGA